MRGRSICPYRTEDLQDRVDIMTEIMARDGILCFAVKMMSIIIVVADLLAVFAYHADIGVGRGGLATTAIVLFGTTVFWLPGAVMIWFDLHPERKHEFITRAIEEGPPEPRSDTFSG